MPDLDIPSNSKYAQPKQEKRKSVAQGRVYKKSLWERAKDDLFVIGKEDIKSYVKETIQAAIVDRILSFVDDGGSILHDIISECLEDEDDRRRRDRRSRHIRNYERSSIRHRDVGRDRRRDDRDDRRDERRGRARTEYEVDEIVFDSKAEINDVLQKLDEDLDEYGAVTVANYYDYASCDSSSNDAKWGWTDLSEAEIHKVSGGYVCIMPQPKHLD